MSGGSNSNTSSSSTSAPPWAQDFAKDYVGKAGEVSNTPYVQSPGQVVAPNAAQNSAWQSIESRALQGSPVQSAANSTLTDTLQGKYVNSNPHLQGMIDSASQDVTRNYNEVTRPGQDAAMVRSGSFGNSGLQAQTQRQDAELQKTLGGISTNMRGQAYTQERGYQQAALGYAPQYAQSDYNDANQLLAAGNQQQGQAQQAANQDYNWWQEAQNYPTNKLNTYGNAIGTALGSGRTTTSTTPGTSAGAGLLGGSLTGSQLGAGMNDGSGGNYAGWGAAIGALAGLLGR